MFMYKYKRAIISVIAILLVISLLAGFIVMVSGYILMTGGGSDDPQVFNYAMFDFRRLVAAPVVIVLGIVIEIVAIMKVWKSKDKEE